MPRSPDNFISHESGILISTVLGYRVFLLTESRIQTCILFKFIFLDILSLTVPGVQNEIEIVHWLQNSIGELEINWKGNLRKPHSNQWQIKETRSHGLGLDAKEEGMTS